MHIQIEPNSLEVLPVSLRLLFDVANPWKMTASRRHSNFLLSILQRLKTPHAISNQYHATTEPVPQKRKPIRMHYSH